MNINLTLFGQMLAFTAFVLFCMKYVWPPIQTAMRERTEKISAGLLAAERAEKDLELAQKKAVQRLQTAKEEAGGIIDAANRRASQIVDEAKQQARIEGERLKEAAQAEIDQEFNRAREQLRGQVAGLALAGAEKILAAEINPDHHAELVDRLAAQL